MQSSTGSVAPSSDLFIVLETFRSGFIDFVRALEPLSGAAQESPLLGASDIYYRADTDIALLTIRFDREAITPQKLAWLTSVAARADLPVLDPSRLGFSDRRAFYEEYLPNYRVRVEARSGPQDALEELARLLALPDAPPVRPAPSPGRPLSSEGSGSRRPPSNSELNGRYGAARTVGDGPGARAMRPGPSGSPVGPDVVGPVGPSAASSAGAGAIGAPGTSARGTGNGPAQPRGGGYTAISRTRPARRRQGPALTSPEVPRVIAPEDLPALPALDGGRRAAEPPTDVTRPADELPAPVYSVARARMTTPPRMAAIAPVAPGARSLRSAPTAPGGPVVVPPPPILPVQARGTTGVSAAPGASPAPLGAGDAAPGTEVIPAETAVGAKRPAVIVDEDDAPPALQVRFLRGDHWAPARLRALSLQGARLASAAPPRPGDMVDLALGLDHLDVLVRGEVTQVTTAAQAAVSGEPSGFSLHFMPLEGEPRARLVGLLKRAKQGGLSLRPPPPRASVRFPVRWPAGVITSWGEVNTAALDVSRSGLFLASTAPIGTRQIIFHLPMDTTGRALSGRAQIAREVSEDMAASRGLTRGYGVRILDFTRNDAARYDSFLDRVRVRTEKRIMIAARRERGTELGRGLIAAGYAVHSGNDLGALTLSVDDGPAPDAALIDAGLLGSDPAAGALQRALHARQVPCLTIGNEQSERARAVVDHLLHIT